MTEQDIAEKNITELVDKSRMNKLIKEAVFEIRFTKGNKWQYLISILISSALSWFLIINDTVFLFDNINEMFLNLSIAFVAMIFSGYSIFQALLSEKLILELIKVKSNLLKTSNKSFLNLILLYLASILINIIIKTVISGMDKHYMLLNNVKICNILAFVLIFCYLLYHILILLEVMIFTINLYRMFCLHNALQAVDALDFGNEEE